MRGPLLDVRWIDDFLALVECRSFTRAAKQRNISQSGLSRRIQALEQWAGAPLLDRLAQPLGLTWPGHCFIAQARRLRDALGTMKQMVACDPDDPLVCVTTVIADGLSRLACTMLSEPVQRQVPRACLDIHFDRYKAARAGLEAGQVMLWLVAQDPLLPIDIDPQKFEAKVVQHDRLLPVVAAMGDRPLHTLPGSRQHKVPVIDYDPIHPLASLEGLRRTRNLTQVHLQPGTSADSMDMARHLVASGAGIGILLESMVREQLDSGQLMCARPEWARPIDVLLVRSRQAGITFTGAAVEAADRLWSLHPGLRPSSRPPVPDDDDERGTLMVSDVVTADAFARSAGVGPMPQRMRDAHPVRMSR